MRKSICVFVIILLCAAFLTPMGYCDTKIKKLGRGITNLATCPLEICKNMQDVNVEDGFFASLSVGVLQGLWKTGVRGIAGIYEICTFPFETVKDNAPIVKDPEFFLEP